MKRETQNKEKPIFIFAASWRTGSTLLQRVLNASGSVFIYGEPGFISNARILFNQNENYLQKVSWNREKNQIDKQGQWIPIFNPPVENLYKAFKCYFNTLYDLQTIGIDTDLRWGFKEVRDNAYENSVFLKKIFPQSKFVYLIRNPFDMYISLKGQDAIFNNFKDKNPFYPIEVWNRNVSFFLNKKKVEEVDGYVVKYEEIMDSNKNLLILKELAKHLDIAFDKKMLNELTIKVGDSKIKNPLTQKEVKKINAIIMKNNEILNYEIGKDKIKRKLWF